MQEISFRDDILPLKDKLFRLALRITFNRAEAEDIVQDALIKVWSKREEWAQLESIEAYCLTVVRNLAIDRSQKKEAQNLELTPETQEMPDALTPESQMERNEQFRLVHRLINELPEKRRTIVQLRDIEGKSYREIADVLLAVNRPYGKSDYIPCICWGRNARYASAFEVGGHVLIWGRIQSREYMKRIGENETEKRVAYEVSVSKLEYME